MSSINLPFAASGDRRAPNVGELSAGFPCGPLDLELFNWLHWWTTGQFDEAITAAGLTADDAVLVQLAQAIARSASGSTWFVAGGTANAITLAGTGAFQVPSAYFAGMRVRFVPAVANTGAVTINVAGIGAVAARGRRGGALIDGDLLTGEPVEFVHDGTYFRSAFPLISDALATPYLGFHGDPVSQSISHNVLTRIADYSGTVNNLPGASLASGIITIGTTGYYAVTANMASLMPDPVSNYSYVVSVSVLDVIDAPILSVAATPVAATTASLPGTLAGAASGIAKLTAGDRIAVFFRHNQGTAQNVSLSLDVEFRGA